MIKPARDAWYVEEMNFRGWYSPTLYYGDPPTEKRTEGRKKNFKLNPVKVDPIHTGLPLYTLKTIYGKA